MDKPDDEELVWNVEHRGRETITWETAVIICLLFTGSIAFWYVLIDGLIRILF